MIDKNYEGYMLCCDICMEENEGPFEHFADAVEHKLGNGWKSRKIKGEWHDVCPECAKEGQSTQ
jgi:hypothetical protein